jgi:hypothetical protein
VKGIVRIGIFALVDIEKGAELTYDYNFHGFWQEGREQKCLCGAENCCGYLGKDSTHCLLLSLSLAFSFSFSLLLCLVACFPLTGCLSLFDRW